MVHRDYRGLSVELEQRLWCIEASRLYGACRAFIVFIGLIGCVLIGPIGHNALIGFKGLIGFRVSSFRFIGSG